MRRKIFLVILTVVVLFFLPGEWSAAIAADAGFWLTCDLQAEVTTYQVEVNGVEQEPVLAEVGGVLMFPLSGMAGGAYKFRARASGAGGWWTDWSEPFFTFRPKAVGGLNIIKK